MKIKNRIFSSIFFCSFFTLALALLLLTRVMYSALTNDLHTEIRNEAVYLSDAVNYFDDSTEKTLEYITETGKKSSNRITLCLPDGTVLYDNFADAARLDNHLGRPEISDAIKHGTGEILRSSDTLGEQTFYYAVLLENRNILRIANTSKSAAGMLGISSLWIILTAVLVMVISAAAAAILTQKIVKPVNEIDLENPADNGTYDELSPLLLRINRQNKKINAQLDELTHQKNELAYITENMNEGLVIFDSRGNILAINSAAKTVFDGSASDTYTHLCRAKEFTDTVEKSLSGEKSAARYEKNGRIYRLTASPVSDNGGYAAVLFVMDITEQETAEQVRREFSANVSHELKTPLTSIMGAAELIEAGITKQEDIPDFAKKIHSEAARLLSLIEDIIKISCLDETDLGREFENVQLDEICGTVLNDLENKAADRNVLLKSDIDKVQLYGVKTVLYEMIYNLCDNGIMYNKQDGYVRLELHKYENGCVLKIEDSGIGIPAEHKPRIFERFYRVDKSRSKERGGTGLGLSIVKHGAELHKAKIDLESKIGEGTEITIAFDNLGI